MKKFNYIIAALLLFTGGTFAQSNIANVTESGQGQQAKIDQNGILNQSYVNQSNKANTALVTQINMNKKTNTFSEVNQTGEINNAKVEQTSNAKFPMSTGKIEA